MSRGTVTLWALIVLMKLFLSFLTMILLQNIFLPTYAFSLSYLCKTRINTRSFGDLFFDRALLESSMSYSMSYGFGCVPLFTFFAFFFVYSFAFSSSLSLTRRSWAHDALACMPQTILKSQIIYSAGISACRSHTRMIRMPVHRTGPPRLRRLRPSWMMPPNL